MTSFALIWLLLVAAAAGLSVGAWRGRPLPGGPCAVRAVRGPAACGACAAFPPDAAEPAGEGGSEGAR